MTAARNVIAKWFSDAEWGDSDVCDLAAESLLCCIEEAPESVRLELAEMLNPWRTIETAPKDQFIMLWCPEDQSQWLAKWQGGRWYGVDDQGLTREGIGPEDVTGWKPTHWLPLPAPPSEGK